DALDNLYPKLSPGGFVIVDDYNALPQCKEAVHDFRGRHLVEDEMLPIDQDSVYWRKAGNDFPGPSDTAPSVRDLLKLLFRKRS
ncbi:MAG: TylF/MycF/NovP-related O-methyltransferase, partial [Sulfuricaulis sp.]|nr:TylF/MycF/NovP-related O-methyltransferase [Sulfuricaulis sp.]